MGRRKLALDGLDLKPGAQAPNKPDKAEEIANRILEMFDLEVDDDQFDAMCDLIEEVALNKHGDLKDHRSLTAICAHVAQVKVPDDVRTALLLVLLKDRFKNMRARLAHVAARDDTKEVIRDR